MSTGQELYRNTSAQSVLKSVFSHYQKNAFKWQYRELFDEISFVLCPPRSPTLQKAELVFHATQAFQIDLDPRK